MIAKRLRSAAREEEGSTMVEFGLVSLLVVMLIFGVFEVCRMVLIYNDVSNAVAEGVRYAAVHGQGLADSSQVQTVVRNYLSSAPMTASNATVNACFDDHGDTCGVGACESRSAGPNVGKAPVGSYVTVCVNYLYDPFVNYFPMTVNLGSQSQGVILY
jgi:Flp pilus assembly protein TadG